MFMVLGSFFTVTSCSPTSPHLTVYGPAYYNHTQHAQAPSCNVDDQTLSTPEQGTAAVTVAGQDKTGVDLHFFPSNSSESHSHISQVKRTPPLHGVLFEATCRVSKPVMCQKVSSPPPSATNFFQNIPAPTRRSRASLHSRLFVRWPTFDSSCLHGFTVATPLFFPPTRPSTHLISSRRQ